MNDMNVRELKTTYLNIFPIRKVLLTKGKAIYTFG